jgi:hypothetical protein
METIQLQIPTTLWQRLRPYQDNLVQLLEWGLRYLEQQKIKPKVMSRKSLKDELLHIGQQCAALPILDWRSADEILGYNEIGVAVW